MGSRCSSSTACRWTTSTQYNIATQQPLNGGTIFPPNPLSRPQPRRHREHRDPEGRQLRRDLRVAGGPGRHSDHDQEGAAGSDEVLAAQLAGRWTSTPSCPALQTEYGQGSGGVAETCVPSTDPALIGCGPQVSTASYGPKLAAGTPVYDHANEIFQHGYTTDNNLTVSGGSDRTQFFLSGGYNYDRGIVIGNNNHYRRISVRFNGESADHRQAEGRRERRLQQRLRRLRAEPERHRRPAARRLAHAARVQQPAVPRSDLRPAAELPVPESRAGHRAGQPRLRQPVLHGQREARDVQRVPHVRRHQRGMGADLVAQVQRNAWPRLLQRRAVRGAGRSATATAHRRRA